MCVGGGVRKFNDHFEKNNFVLICAECYLPTHNSDTHTPHTYTHSHCSHSHPSPLTHTFTLLTLHSTTTVWRTPFSPMPE